MKKFLFLILFALLLFHPLFASSQLDITLNIPYYTGLTIDDNNIGEAIDYAFIIPEIKWCYNFGPKIIHFGIGLKAYTAIVQSVIYPIVNVESKLGPLILNIDIGGKTYFLFGLYNDFQTGDLFLGEASIAYKFKILSNVVLPDPFGPTMA